MAQLEGEVPTISIQLSDTTKQQVGKQLPAVQDKEETEP
jgi:hypothetical protein